jgi:hypothetical protein
VKDFDGPDPGRWTEPVAVLKFDTYPADCELALRYLVPNFVAKPPLKTLTVRVNGDTVGTATVEKDGDQFVRFRVKASQITRQGFTMVELSVDKPYKDAGGNEYGVVLNEAGFEYPVGR